MSYSLSTRWNASRHTSGESLVAEIRDMGFTHLELGFDLTLDLVSGIRKARDAGEIVVDSLHNFCPVPLGAMAAHPEIYTLASQDPHIRSLAQQHISATLRFAAEIGARCVVLHAGNVDMPNLSRELIRLQENGEAFSRAYEKTKMALIETRSQKAPPHLENLYRELENLVPVLEECQVSLALENLPTWEALPTEIEMEQLLAHFNHPRLRYWHDIGHAVIRETLGLSNHRRWLERLKPYLVGFHIHDVIPPAEDHRMPSFGKVNFDLLKPFVNGHIIKVLEPGPRIPRAEVEAGLKAIQACWGDPPASPA